MDFNRDLHGGVRELICEIAHHISKKGWLIKDFSNPYNIISQNECEAEVYLGIEEYTIRVKTIEDPHLTTPCKEYYCVEINEVRDATGVNRMVFYGWTVARLVDKVQKQFS